MSYCRFIEADAYIYDDINQGIICCMCSLKNSNFVAGYDYDLMLNHIEDHRIVGDYIPEYVDERLKEEKDSKDA